MGRDVVGFEEIDGAQVALVGGKGANLGSCPGSMAEHATRLIQDGQRIRVYGTDGYVEIVPVSEGG